MKTYYIQFVPRGWWRTPKPVVVEADFYECDRFINFYKFANKDTPLFSVPVGPVLFVEEI